MKLLIKFLFFKTKVSFLLPSKKDVLLYDEMHSYILDELLSKNDYNILKLRKKKIFFWIFIKQIINFDFKFSTYCKNFINYTSPKVIITFNDARFELYELKKNFSKIYFISVMNGLRLEHWFRKRFNHKKLNYKCDFFFTLNKYYIPYYQKLIDSDFKVLGHFRNNTVELSETKILKEFLIISQIHVDELMFNFHKKLLSFINIYLKKSSKKIYILLRRSENHPKESEEKNFYKNIFEDNCVFYQSSNWKKKYEIIDKFENIIFTWSTMGYEAIARRKKVAVFSPSKINNYDYHFGYPAPYNKKFNFFSTENITFYEVQRILDNIYNCSQSQWNKQYYESLKNIFHFDKDNNELKNLIIKLSNMNH